MANYFVRQNGASAQGPFEEDRISGWIAQGRVRAEMEISGDGRTWIPVSEHRLFASAALPAAQGAPPPLVSPAQPAEAVEDLDEDEPVARSSHRPARRPLARTAPSSGGGLKALAVVGALLVVGGIAVFATNSTKRSASPPPTTYDGIAGSIAMGEVLTPDALVERLGRPAWRGAIDWSSTAGTKYIEHVRENLIRIERKAEQGIRDSELAGLSASEAEKLRRELKDTVSDSRPAFEAEIASYTGVQELWAYEAQDKVRETRKLAAQRRAPRTEAEIMAQAVARVSAEVQQFVRFTFARQSDGRLCLVKRHFGETSFDPSTSPPFSQTEGISARPSDPEVSRDDAPAREVTVADFRRRFDALFDPQELMHRVPLRRVLQEFGKPDDHRTLDGTPMSILYRLADGEMKAAVRDGFVYSFHGDKAAEIAATASEEDRRSEDREVAARRAKLHGWDVPAVPPNAARPPSGPSTATPKEGQADLQSLEQAVREEPRNAAAHHNLAIGYRGAQRWAEAEAESRKAIDLGLETAEAWQGLGIALERLGRSVESARAFERAVERAPDDPILLDNLSVAYSNQQRWVDAVRVLEQANQLDRSNVKFQMDLGAAYSGARRFDDAEQAFRRAVALDPKRAKVFYNWGNSLADQEKWDAAIEKFTKAVELDAALAAAWDNLGAALTHRGRYSESEVAFRRVVQLESSNAEAKFNLGLVLVEQGKLGDAKQQHQQLLRADADLAAKLKQVIDRRR